jgi:hypothetical protein
MADDIQMENYKKNVQKLVDEWKKDLQSSIKELDSLIEQIKKLQSKKEIKQVAAGPQLFQAKRPATSSLSMRGGKNKDDDDADSDKKIEDLRKKANALKKELEKATDEFRKTLARDIIPPAERTKMAQPDVRKIGAMTEDVVEYAIPVGKYVKIPLDSLGYDFKTMKPTSASINFSIEF